ncbi:MAG: glycoside hydrolase [Flavobacteriaceae bacterium]|nr:glycoside hydrolase [Flavobacteriaceae bacterium]
MRQSIFFSLLFVYIILSCSKSVEIEIESSEEIKNSFVVGYLPTWRFDLNNQIDFCKLTHLNLAFANPDSSGKIIMPEIKSVVSNAKSQNPNIIISISLAGGVLSDEQSKNWSNLIDNPENVNSLVSNIVQYVIDNNIDGVDVDLEWQNVTTGYSNFVIRLNSELDKHSKIITAALPATTRFNNISDEAIATFDLIHIMAYDFTGPWNPNNAGQHSSYSHALQSIDFWTNSVGISPSKLTLGIPFYGYDFSNSNNVTAFTYSSLVGSNKNYADVDNVGLKFFNGRPTIKTKVKLASDRVGGVMIWELGQDNFGDLSLLKTIHEEFLILGIETTKLCK